MNPVLGAAVTFRSFYRHVQKKTTTQMSWTYMYAIRNCIQGALAFALLVWVLGQNVSHPSNDTLLTLIVFQTLAFGFGMYYTYTMSKSSSQTVLDSSVMTLGMIASLLIGAYVFGESLTYKNIVGIGLSVIAISLMNGVL